MKDPVLNCMSLFAFSKISRYKDSIRDRKLSLGGKIEIEVRILIDTWYLVLGIHFFPFVSELCIAPS